jgi:hypothetical protein
VLLPRTLPFVLALCLSAVATADIVRLVNGSEVRGRVVEETPREVVIAVGGGTLRFPRADVLEVVREDEAASLRGEAREMLRLGQTKRAVELLWQALAAGDRDAGLPLSRALRAVAGREQAAGQLDAAARTLAEARRAATSGRGNPHVEAELARLDGLAAEIEAGRAEARAAAERGVELLHGEAWEEARSQLARAVARDVGLAAGLRAARAIAAGRAGMASLGEDAFALAAVRLEEALLLAPSLPPEARRALAAARCAVAAQRISRDDIDGAERALRRAGENDPTARLPWLYLGVLLEQRGAHGACARAYRRALGAEGGQLPARAPAEVLRRAALAACAPLPLSPQLFRVVRRGAALADDLTERASAGGFVAHARHAAVAGAVARAAAAAGREVLAWSGAAAPSAPVPIYVLDTNEEFRAVTAQRFHVLGLTHLRRSRSGEIVSRAIYTFAQAPGLLDRVVPHEVAHALATGDAGPLPLWLEEGVAVASVPAERAAAIARCRAGLAGEEGGSSITPLGDLLALGAYPAGAAAQRDFYDTAAVLTAFLAERPGGRRRLLEAARRHPGDARSLLTSGCGFASVDACERELRRWLAGQ